MKEKIIMINIEDIVTEKYLDNKIDDEHFIQLLEYVDQSDKTEKLLRSNCLLNKKHALTTRDSYDREYERQKKAVIEYDDELKELQQKIKNAKEDKDYETVKLLKKKYDKLKMLRKSEYLKLKYANEHRKKMDKTVKQLGMSKYIRVRKY